METKENISLGNKSIETANVKLTFLQKLPFFGATFGGFAWPIIMAFLMMFWTDVALIPASLASVFLLASKLWDAINDPIIGYIADRTQTRFGRYRPWILSFIPTAVLGQLVFTTIPGASQTTQSWFSFIMYFIFVLFMTMGEVPGLGVVAATTTDPSSRGSIMSYRMAGAYACNIITGAAFMPLVLKFAFKAAGEGAPPDMSHGFFMAMLIFTIAGLPFGLYYFLGTKERVTIKVTKHKFSESVKVLKGNGPFWLFFIAFFTYGITSGTTTSRSYYWQYLRGDINGVASNIALWMAGMAAGAIIAGFFLKKMNNKGYVATIFYIFGGIITLVLAFMRLTPESSDNMVLAFNVVTIISGVGISGGTVAMYSIIPDLTEYTQWRYKLRISGFISSLLNCAYKISLAIGAASFTIMLSIMSYVPNVAQPENIQVGINWFSYIIPAICYIIPGLLMLMWKLDKKQFAVITKELAERPDEE